MSTTGIVFSVLAVFFVFALGIYARISLWTSPNLERWMKQDMQGSFVPVVRDDPSKDNPTKT